MGYQVDLLGVGEGDRGGGDAIALRLGGLYGLRKHQLVVVIDGGWGGSGDALVEHIRTHYGTNTVDLVISTHPDADHTTGLRRVVEQLRVRALLMHRPWHHTTAVRILLGDRRVTDRSVTERLRQDLDAAKQLEDTALRRNVEIVEPFQGMSFFNGLVRILGPTRDFYRLQLSNFEALPSRTHAADGMFAALVAALSGDRPALGQEVFPPASRSLGTGAASAIPGNMGLLGVGQHPWPPLLRPAGHAGAPLSALGGPGLLGRISGALAPAPINPMVLAGALAAGRAPARAGEEPLGDEGPGTSAENNTSVITLINAGGYGLLFTGDAGRPALALAADELHRLARSGLAPGRLGLVQVPHHGSRHNVGPTVLDRLIGPHAAASTADTVAVCSCPPASPKHPSAMVMNAIRRRGVPVYVTKGANLCIMRDAPTRLGWHAATPLPFQPESVGGE